MYAGRKRRKPAQKGAKAAPAEGAKSNPSKRHRDRLNSELDRLASLLPFPDDVISSLDKLSILRLSVSYLRNKSFFSAALKSRASNGVTKGADRHGDEGAPADGCIPEGELLLQALNGFVMVITADGSIFFCSHTIQDYLGFHQTDVMHQSVFELIHTEDQQEFRRNLHWALNPPAGMGPPAEPSSVSPDGDSDPSCLVSYNPDQLPPENSSFLERSFVCRFRCLLDNSSGFLALNIQGRLKFLHGQSRQRGEGERGECGSPPQLALFAVATPLQPPAILEIRTRNMIFRTKHKLDFTPMACDAKGKIVLGYTEAELRVRGSGYQFIHAADMLYCAENHVRMIKTGESGLTVFRLLTKDNRWKWVQANARLVYKNGKPDYIIATQRPLADEEGGEHLRKRSMHLPFTFATGEALLYHTSYPLHGFPDSSQGKAKGGKSKKSKLDKGSSDEQGPKSLLGALMSQDESVYVCQPDPEPKNPHHSSLFGKEPDDSETLGSLLSEDSWRVIPNGDTGTTSFDPLLATLDSLSLEGDDTCSNSELFNALENLGLNAEDLELLLLDERMIQVEMDPGHIPTLSDLLTNNEILSYIHDSLEGGAQRGEERGGGGGERGGGGDQGVPQQPPLPSGQPPIVHLSQQMQQHMGQGDFMKQGHVQAASNPDTQVPPGVPNSHWVFPSEGHQHPHPAKQLNGERKHPSPLGGSGQQWQLQPEPQQQLHLQQVSAPSAPLSGFHNQPGGFAANGHSAFPPGHELGRSDYATPGSAANGSEVCHYQSLVSPRPYQPQGLHKHQHQHQHQPRLHQNQGPASCSPHSATQSSTLELEQLLGLTQPSVEAYSMFNGTAPDAPRSKLENGCLLSATNAAYIRTCLMPNGNAGVTGDIPVPCPEGLPALQDPQRSGFFL